MNRTKCGALGALGWIVVSVGATPAVGGEPRTHDGFFLRLSAGGGYGETKIGLPSSLGGGDLKLSGGAGDVNLAIGGAIKPNLIVHGTLWGWAVSSPDVEVPGASGTADANLTMSAFGVGLTYYVMPVNFYISPSVGISELSIEENNVSYSTDPGFALDATIGKEWWVSDGWALGAAAGFSWHTVSDSDINENWSGPGFGIRFSATMN